MSHIGIEDGGTKIAPMISMDTPMFAKKKPKAVGEATEVEVKTVEPETSPSLLLTSSDVIP